MKFELNFFARVLQHLNLNITRQGQIQGFLVNLRFFQRGWDCSHNLQMICLNILGVAKVASAIMGMVEGSRCVKSMAS